jgi:hypothetical protein
MVYGSEASPFELLDYAFVLEETRCKSDVYSV